MSSHACSPCDRAEDAQQQLTQSSVLLLLQEATKLAAPAGDESSSSGDNPDSRSLIIKDRSSEFTGSFSIMRKSDCSSAWEVMCLINQQCERLLRSGCEDGGQAVLDSSDITEITMPSPLAERPSVSSSSIASDACVSVAVVYSSELTDLEETVEPEDLADLIKINTAEEICTAENTSVLHVESTEERPSDQGESAGLSTGSDCPLDFTSCLVSEREHESVWLHLNTSESTQARGRSDLNNNLLESLNQEIQDQPSRVTRRRTQRKQPRPARSPDPQDADVQGVTFSMHPELDAAADQSRLIITSNYSGAIRRLRRSRSRSRSLQTSQRSSSSEEESDSCSLSRSKICASCRTRKTPLWRDAEDGTPLCNACGIRYKKYRVRCRQCWNIPKKEANTNSQCLKCGDVLKLKSSGW